MTPLPLGLLVLPLLLAGCCDQFLGRPATPPPVHQPITIPVTAAPAVAEPGLDLWVEITPAGFLVGSPGATLSPDDGLAGPTLPCATPSCPSVDDYDYEGLTELLVEIKAEYPDERELLVRVHPAVDYEVVVRVLDAARSRGDRELFPEVALSLDPPGSRP